MAFFVWMRLIILDEGTIACGKTLKGIFFCIFLKDQVIICCLYTYVLYKNLILYYVS